MTQLPPTPKKSQVSYLISFGIACALGASSAQAEVPFETSRFPIYFSTTSPVLPNWLFTQGLADPAGTPHTRALFNHPIISNAGDGSNGFLSSPLYPNFIHQWTPVIPYNLPTRPYNSSEPDNLIPNGKKMKDVPPQYTELLNLYEILKPISPTPDRLKLNFRILGDHIEVWYMDQAVRTSPYGQSIEHRNMVYFPLYTTKSPTATTPLNHWTFDIFFMDAIQGKKALQPFKNVRFAWGALRLHDHTGPSSQKVTWLGDQGGYTRSSYTYYSQPIPAEPGTPLTLEWTDPYNETHTKTLYPNANLSKYNLDGARLTLKVPSTGDDLQLWLEELPPFPPANTAPPPINPRPNDPLPHSDPSNPDYVPPPTPHPFPSHLRHISPLSDPSTLPLYGPNFFPPYKPQVRIN